MNVLVAYSHFSSYVNTTREYLESFQLIKNANVRYINVVQPEKKHFDLTGFDVVIFSYCARLCFPNYVCPAFLDSVRDFKGLKVVCIQDEYDFVNREVEQLQYIGVDLVLTCVPPESWEYVYPKAKLPGVSFRQVLTGYVSRDIPPRSSLMSLEQRPILIGYRGRQLPIQYGELGRLKFNIGVEIKKRALDRGFKNIDIEWTEDKRIYGPNWNNWLGQMRCTLVTESGSNVFDFDGSITSAMETSRKTGQPPSQTIIDLIQQRETEVHMNQISPRVFEAIAYGSCLIAFEGDYSGRMEPWRHYLPLKKDYSNIDEILNATQDLKLLKELFERAYTEVVLDQRNTYYGFIDIVDYEVNKKLKEKSVVLNGVRKKFDGKKEKCFTSQPLNYQVTKKIGFRSLLSPHLMRYYMGRIFTHYIFKPKEFCFKAFDYLWRKRKLPHS